MSAAATQQTPAVPPRPSRGMGQESPAATGSIPKIPPRPMHKRIDRSVSPNPDRFAPSPLSGGVVVNAANAATRTQYLGVGERGRADEAIDRSSSVPMPSVGEEGVEYSAVADELKQDVVRSSSPEQTRTVGEDLKLHAPKPSLPAASAKQQVMAVTRTDSDRAASFGIGRPGSTAGERSASRNSNRKRPGSSYSAHSDHPTDDEQGIPEIGQRVPMNPLLGDVQAPSPGPGAASEGVAAKKHHGRKNSARGLPPGSYGLHGHGVASQDKLDKAYYQKHPDVLEREQHTPLHDRQNDFAMSSTDLNRLVRETANRHSAPGTAELRGTPNEEVAFQASEEYTSRISSRPASATPHQKAAAHADAAIPDDNKPIHVDDARHPEFYSCGDEDNAAAEEEHEYSAPILAPDQISNDPGAQLPAIHPHPERRDSLESDEPSSRPTSRSGHNRGPSYQRPEFGSTPLEDVEEYEPLFAEEVKEEVPKEETADENHLRHHFPSRDIWEDAPSSTHYTAEVTAPEQPEHILRKASTQHEDRPITPAQAFAQYQEQLAEKEATGRTNSLPLAEEKPTWVSHQPHLSPTKISKRASTHRFPSRDVWEETPESQLQEAVVSALPAGESNHDSAAHQAKRSSDPEPPAIPDRPKPRQGSGDNSTKPRPPVSDKPKPSIPPRPVKTFSGDATDSSGVKAKPAVPARPAGSKIAALQAGFMSDLNKRLQLGPQAPKKEDPAEDDEGEEKEKAPLSDARKGRARGPQRRAPAAKTSAAAATSSNSAEAPAITLTFSIPQTAWSLDPDDGDIAVGTENEATPDSGTEAEEYTHPAPVHVEQVPGGDRSQHLLVEEPGSMSISPGAVDAEQGRERQAPAPSISAEGAGDTKPEARNEPVTMEKTLVANMAGESVLETTVKKSKDGNEVEPVEVHDDVKA